jgi:phosphatidylserine/phosphatidylglycerophosphate/cardiolipin synthase-like enzyme
MRHTAPALLLSLSIGCAAEGPAGGDESPDGEREIGLAAGKADGAGFTECELGEVVALLNDPETTLAELRGANVHSRAAKNLIAHRDGGDRTYGTDDDDPFDGIDEVDAVPYVGAAALRALVLAVTETCAVAPGTDVEVIFSPQLYADSHLPRVAAAIDAAQRSIDVAMYSFRDAGIKEALRRAVGRGVRIRFLFEGAQDDRRSLAGTTSAQLEEMGIDVRYVNKIMHHKMALIDAPQAGGDDPLAAVLITGSGNWSNSAGTRYDENTLIVRRNAELVLRFQSEFDHLWSHSRDIAWNPALTYRETAPVDLATMPDDPGLDAAFTSANFEATFSSRYGHGFSVVPGRDEVADRIVALIDGATRSIHVASGHLRSRPVAEAILRKHAEDPSVEIRIYLDGQEWISTSAHGEQDREIETCLAEAGADTADAQACWDVGYLWSLAVHRAGIPVRFKYYAYRWDASYAVQMHHKYVVVDGRWLVTGSYNLSDNAEHETMENVVILDGTAYPGTVAAFEARFAQMWETGRADGLYAGLLARANDRASGDFPIVFAPMALDWPEVDALKRAMRAGCPLIDSAEYRSNAPAHQICDR